MTAIEGPLSRDPIVNKEISIGVSEKETPMNIRSQSTLFGGMKAPSDELLRLVSEPASDPSNDFHPELHRKAWSNSYNIPCLFDTVESSAMTMMDRESHLGAGSTGMKLASVISFYTNSLLIQQSTASLARAKKIQDVTGEELARISAIRAGMNISNTAVTTTIRGLTLASLETMTKAIRVAKQALSYISAGLESIIYTLLMVPATLSATKQIHFQHEFNNFLNVGRDPYQRAIFGMGYLMDLIDLTNVDREKALSIFDTEDLKVMLEQEVELTQEEYDQLTDEDLLFIDRQKQALVQKILSQEKDPLNRKLVSEHVELRLAKKIAEMRDLKDVEFSRAIGTETLQKMKKELHRPKEMQLVERLSHGEASATGLEDAEGIIELALSESRNNLTVNILLVFGCIIGISGLIVVSVFTGGLPLYVGLSILIVSELFMVGLDLYDFLEELKQMKAAPKDRIALFVLSIVSIVCIGVGAFLAPGPLARLIVILLGVIFAGFQLGVLGWAWANHQNTQKV